MKRLSSILSPKSSQRVAAAPQASRDRDRTANRGKSTGEGEQGSNPEHRKADTARRAAWAALLIQRQWKRYQDKKQSGWAHQLLSLFVERPPRSKGAIRIRVQLILIYCAYLVCLFVSILSETESEYLYHYKQGVKVRIADGTFEDRRDRDYLSLWNVTSVSLVYQWLNTSLFDALYSPRLPENSLGTLLGQDVIIGGVRVGQIRSRSITCSSSIEEVEREQESLGLHCYRDLSFDSGISWGFEDQQDFGFGSPLFQWRGELGNMTESERTQLFSWTRGKLYSSIPSPAYTLTFPRTSLSTARALLLSLIERSYLDSATRVLFLDLNTYDPVNDAILVVRILFEFQPFGGIIPSYQSMIGRNYPQYFRLVKNPASDVLVHLFYLYFLIGVALNVRMKGWDYISAGHNLPHFLNILLFLVIIIYRYMAAFVLYPSGFNVQGDEYVPLWAFAAITQTIKYLYSLCLFFSLFLMISYLQIIPQFALVGDIILKTAARVVGLFTLFSLFLLGSASAFVTSFGSSLSSFKTFGDSFYTIVEAVVGRNGLLELREAHPFMGPLLYVFCIASVVLVGLNIMIAIILVAYSISNMENQSMEDVKLGEEILNVCQYYLFKIPFIGKRARQRWAKRMAKKNKEEVIESRRAKEERIRSNRSMSRTRFESPPRSPKKDVPASAPDEDGGEGATSGERGAENYQGGQKRTLGKKSLSKQGASHSRFSLGDPSPFSLSGAPLPDFLELEEMTKDIKLLQGMVLQLAIYQEESQKTISSLQNDVKGMHQLLESLSQGAASSGGGVFGERRRSSLLPFSGPPTPNLG